MVDDDDEKTKKFHAISSLIMAVLHGSINKSKVKHRCELRIGLESKENVNESSSISF